MVDALAHILTTSRTSLKFAIPCNDINILIPELVGLGRYMLALHKRSQNTLFLLICMVDTVTFFVFLSISRGMAQLIHDTLTGQCMQPFLI